MASTEVNTVPKRQLLLKDSEQFVTDAQFQMSIGQSWIMSVGDCEKEPCKRWDASCLFLFVLARNCVSVGEVSETWRTCRTANEAPLASMNKTREMRLTS